jgi:hypothetical protein
MIAAVMATLLAAADPASGAAPAQIPPAPVEKSPLQTARENLAQAEQIYAQSCGDRAYAAYDDLCEQLSIQVRNFHIDVDKLERTSAAKARPDTPKP